MTTRDEAAAWSRELRTPRGRVTIDVTRAATGADLAAALNLPAGEVSLDGRRLRPDDRLDPCAVPRGALVAAVGDREPAAPTAVTLTVVSGPGAGRRHDVPRGRAVLGSGARADVALDDPYVAARHLALDVTADRVLVTATGGAADLDGIPLATGVAVPWPPGAVARVGGTVVRLEPRRPRAGGTGRASGEPAVEDDGRRVVLRRHRPTPPLAWLEPPPPPTGVRHGPATAPSPSLAALLVPLATGLVLAAVVDPRLALFALLGPAMTGGSWIEARLRTRHAARRGRATRAAALADLLAAAPGVAATHLDAARRRTPDPAALAPLLHDGHDCWQEVAPARLGVRLGTSGRAVPVTVGDDDPTLGPALAHACWAPDVPAVLELDPGDVLAVAGPRTAARQLTAGIVLTAASVLGPRDLAVTAPPLPWADWLPQAQPTRHAPPWRLHVVDEPAGEHRDRVVRAAAAAGAVVVVLVDDPGTAPAGTAAVVALHGPGDDATVHHDGSTWRVQPALVPDDVAVEVAAAAARLRDPEAPPPGSQPPPRHVPGDPRALVRAWDRACVERSCTAGLGRSAQGALVLDLVADGPHVLVAGTTGSGKSVLLQALVVDLALRHAPDDCALLLVDFKGGATFDPVAGLPHVVGVVTDLDGGPARLLRGLQAELCRRERALRDLRAPDLAGLDPDRRRALGLGRLVVVVDEFAALRSSSAGGLDALVDVAQRGRSLGLHLVLATQRPAGVVSDRIRANTDCRIALRVVDAADSHDVVGSPDAAALPADEPGTALVRLPGQPLQRVRCDDVTRPWRPTVPAAVHVRRHDDPALGDRWPAPPVRQLDAAVEVCRVAWQGVGRPYPRVVVAPPLPRTVDDALVARLQARTRPDEVLVGVADDLDAQRHAPATWRPGDGALLVLGAPAADPTGVVLGIADQLARRADVHAIDHGTGRVRTALAGHAAVGCVAAADDGERQRRLLVHLATVLGERTDGPIGSGRPVLLLVDRLDLLWDELATPGRLDERGLLLDVLSRGPAHRIHVVATSARSTGLGAAAAATVAERLVLRLADDVEHAAAGLRHDEVPAALPGRARLASTRHEVQALRRDRLTAVARRVPPPDPLDPVAADLDLADLPRASRQGATLALPIGRDVVRLGPAALVLGAGQHVLVAGPRRSGRTTALRAIAAQVHDAAPGARLVWTSGADEAPGVDGVERRPGTETVTAVQDALRDGSEVVLLVDDAERVAAPGLAELVAAAPARLLVVAVGETSAARLAHGSVLAVVRRARTGLLLHPDAADGDLLGARLRGVGTARRPGRGVLVMQGRCREVQVARPGRADTGTSRRAAA